MITKKEDFKKFCQKQLKRSIGINSQQEHNINSIVWEVLLKAAENCERRTNGQAQNNSK